MINTPHRASVNIVRERIPIVTREPSVTIMLGKLAAAIIFAASFVVTLAYSWGAIS